MTITLCGTDCHKLFEEVNQSSKFADDSSEFETILKYPKLLGAGYCREMQLRPGLGLFLFDHVASRDLRITSSDREHSIELGFVIAGQWKCNHRSWNDHTSLSPGTNFLFGSGICPGGTSEHSAHERHLLLTIEFEPQLLGTLVTGQPESLPECLEPLIGDSNQLTYFCTGTTTIAMQSVLQHILNCPYEGLTKRMYLEGKVLELMALQFSQLLMAEKPSRSLETRSLRSDEIDRIHHAQMLLGQNLDSPPSVLDLARQVGVNRRKLNEGFRQVLGTTPFGYVRDRRLEQAQQLLSDPDVSIEQVAARVGYANRGNFAAAFRKKFGINPKAFQLQRRKEI
jgi:AraC-like DNA-binding protein